MNKKWLIEENEDGYICVIESEDGIYDTKEEVAKAAHRLAFRNKTILKIPLDESEDFETTDYTQILSPNEVNQKLSSEFKIYKAEFMITRSREKDLKRAIHRAKIEGNTLKVQKLKIRLDENEQKKRLAEINYHQAKQHLKEANRNLKNKK